MTRLLSVASLLAALLTSPALGAATPEAAREALEAARRAYAASAPFQEVLELELELPDGSRKPRRQVYGVAADGSVFLLLSAPGDAALTVLGAGDRAVALWSHIPGRHAEVPYDGDLASALRRMGASQVNVGAPAAVAAAQGAGPDGFLDALRWGILAPLSVAGVAPVTAGAGGALTEVELTAANGSLTLGLDPETHRFRSVRFALGEGEGQIRANGRFEFTAGPAADAPSWPDLGASTAVATIGALEASQYRLGERAPDLTLRRPDGGALRLAELAGRVVVIDFWATWCIPCWTGLAQTEELAAWASESGLPVTVLAVDTLEQVSGFEEQRDQAQAFLHSRRLEVPLVLDVGGEAFAALRNPGLPSLLVVAPDGTLARYYSGVVEDMVEVVRGDVLALLE